MGKIFDKLLAYTLSCWSQGSGVYTQDTDGCLRSAEPPEWPGPVIGDNCCCWLMMPRFAPLCSSVPMFLASGRSGRGQTNKWTEGGWVVCGRTVAVITCQQGNLHKRKNLQKFFRFQYSLKQEKMLYIKVNLQSLIIICREAIYYLYPSFGVYSLKYQYLELIFPGLSWDVCMCFVSKHLWVYYIYI